MAERSSDLRTNLGTVRGGLPGAPERADIAFIVDEASAGRVRVHAARVVLDPADVDRPRAERELEVVASFWMRREYFVSTFGRVVADIEITPG
jgi:hypothetical protein